MDSWFDKGLASTRSRTVSVYPGSISSGGLLPDLTRLDPSMGKLRRASSWKEMSIRRTLLFRSSGFVASPVLLLLPIVSNWLSFTSPQILFAYLCFQSFAYMSQIPFVFSKYSLFMYLCFQCILFFLAALVSWRKYYCRSTRLRPSSQSSINHQCNKIVIFFCI